MMNKEARIDILDSFRFIAIMMVILFHYYTRWTIPAHTPNLYPYGNAYATCFQYGFLGVEFFFMISGFVILYTLEKSHTYHGFLLKRFIRLFPPMLLCSIATFFLVNILDRENHFSAFHSASYLNFLPSLTFSFPKIWEDIFPGKNWDLIDGAYWSLHVEVAFYLLAGLLYFINKAKFISNWLIFSTIVIAFVAYHDHFSHENDILTIFLDHFKLSDYIMFFTVGVMSYSFFFKKPLTTWNIILFIVLVLYYYHHFYNYTLSVHLLLIFLTVLFGVFTFKAEYLSFLKIGMIQRIGIISYTVYLIHQSVGIILIDKLSKIINVDALFPFIPLLVMALVILFAECSFRFYERPVSSFLKKLWGKYIY
jgi:peptidoglycan/LPS O-acetylase OafA/YrhL